MAKFISLVLVVTAVSVCIAEPARLRNFRQSRFSARQELVEDVSAQTPYPPSGIKPDIPFDLPNEPQQPQEPDNTYLPPDNLLPPVQTYGPPDQFYGPPEASGSGPTSEEDAVEVDAEPVKETRGDQVDEFQDEQSELIAAEPEAKESENPQAERLVLARRFRKQSIKPAKLRSAKLQAIPAARLRSQRLIAQPIYSNNGALLAYRILKV